MPWTAITYVGSGVTLIAFLAAVLAWVIRSKSRERERLIRAAPEAERAALIQDTLEFFRVDTQGLTREQRFNLAVKQVHARSKRYTINAILIFALAIVGALVTALAVLYGDPLTRATPAFDVKIDEVEFSQFGDDKKVVVTYSHFPMSNKIVGQSTIFSGMMTIYNNDMIDSATKFIKEATCSEAPHCITAHVFDNLAVEPIIVRSPSDQPVVAKREFVIPGSVRNIRVYAEFWQRETEDGGRCIIDNSKPAPEHGIPFLKVVNRFGIETDGYCIYARTRDVFPVAL